MIRLLTIAVLAAVIWLLWRQLRSRPQSRRGTTTRKPGQTEKMVACAHCGLHVPVSEALRRDDRSYCSRAHLEAADRR